MCILDYILPPSSHIMSCCLVVVSCASWGPSCLMLPSTSVPWRTRPEGTVWTFNCASWVSETGMLCFKALNCFVFLKHKRWMTKCCWTAYVDTKLLGLTHISGHQITRFDSHQLKLANLKWNIYKSDSALWSLNIVRALSRYLSN